MSDIPRDPPADAGGEEPELDDLDLDEGGEGDDLGDDGPDSTQADEGEEGSEGQARQVTRPTRGESRHARQSRENIELRERLARLEGERSVRPQQPQFDPQAQARADAEFYASLEELSPVEAMKRIEARATQRLGGAMQQQLAQIRDDQDRRDFAALTRADRNAARFLSQVEETAQAIRAQGGVPNREVILDSLVGREVREKAARVAPGQQRQARARVAAQTTRPASGRGDVARGGGQRNQDTADEALLRGIRVGDI